MFVCVRYNPECNTWSMDVPSLSSPRSRVCVLEMDGCLITLGGFDGMTCINTVERSKHTCTLQRIGCLEMWSSNTYTLVFCGVGMTCWKTPGLSWHQCWGTGHLHQPLSWTVRFTLWEEQMETCRWIQVHKHTYMCRFEINKKKTQYSFFCTSGAFWPIWGMLVSLPNHVHREGSFRMRRVSWLSVCGWRTRRTWSVIEHRGEIRPRHSPLEPH